MTFEAEDHLLLRGFGSIYGRIESGAEYTPESTNSKMRTLCAPKYHILTCQIRIFTWVSIGQGMRFPSF